eukprot:TRINITY_DN10049_c0_g1_i1.p1 TRINITY_DN10049_c0_g1~~TRINITY_DN10049_c0_g1_i1.p1  ORF type:complete len:327 (+),score=87.61 TRINITY_DN10049_c0_g1_i1:2-982(+)
MKRTSSFVNAFLPLIKNNKTNYSSLYNNIYFKNYNYSKINVNFKGSSNILDKKRINFGSNSNVLSVKCFDNYSLYCVNNNINIVNRYDNNYSRYSNIKKKIKKKVFSKKVNKKSAEDREKREIFLNDNAPVILKDVSGKIVKDVTVFAQLQFYKEHRLRKDIEEIIQWDSANKIKGKKTEFRVVDKVILTKDDMDMVDNAAEMDGMEAPEIPQKITLRSIKKKTKEEKSTKKMQISTAIQEHDLGVKINKISKFLQKQLKVEVELVFKKMEEYESEFGRDILENVFYRLEHLSTIKTISEYPKAGRMVMFLIPREEPLDLENEENN